MDSVLEGLFSWNLGKMNSSKPLLSDYILFLCPTFLSEACTIRIIDIGLLAKSF